MESRLGFDLAISSSQFDDLLALVAEVEATDEFIEPRLVYPTPPPGVFAYLAPRTQYFFNFAKCKSLWGDAVVAAALHLTTSNGFAAFAALTIRRLVASFERLTEDEAELAHEIIRQSRGRAYDRGAAESDLVASWREATVDVHGLIAALMAKDVVVRTQAGRLALVF
ncbi:hypothetical protein [Plantibacter sp. CFBP 8775]|uniref:hypothetical protein n=1 Tax=Plantibacter sp. CFBP 8775 TaxID=2774038 RepID=UPI00177C4AB3|nr:hypothetical protein [Plantibacter sp. CFBP 8775]MBD8102492.1 hypothetical protein [Plantibacter sp. CFBP 8775]